MIGVIILNTKDTVELVIKEAREKGIKNIVVASTTGDTLSYFKGYDDLHIVGVSNVYDHGTNAFNEQKRKEFKDLGIDIVTAGHALSGAERCFSRRYGGYGPIEIVADTLRMFGQGTKVCVEVSTMALDAGKIPYNEPVIAVAGNGSGANTALILTPSYTNAILNTKIHQFICKPE